MNKNKYIRRMVQRCLSCNSDRVFLDGAYKFGSGYTYCFQCDDCGRVLRRYIPQNNGVNNHQHIMIYWEEIEPDNQP